MVIALIGMIGGVCIANLGQSNEIVVAVFMTIANAFFFAIAGFIADFWKVFVQDGEVEGYKWEHKCNPATVSTQIPMIR
jgi:hypothetical protein